VTGPSARRTLAVLAIALLAANLRPSLIVIAPLLPSIRADLSMTPGLAGLLGAAPPLAFAVFGWLTPALGRLAGYERAAWGAMLVTATAQLTRLLTDDAIVFVALSFAAYAAMGVGNVLLPPLVKLHFPDRIGLVSALYIMLVSVGTALPAFLAVPVADAADWRLSAGVWGVFALTAVYPWLVIRRPPTGDEDPEPAGTGPDRQSIWALLETPLGWGLVVVFGINSLNAYAMMTWLPTILVESGVSTTLSGIYLSVFAFVAIPLAFLVPWLATRVRSATPLVVTFAACYAAGYTGLLLSPTTATPVWVLLAGAGPGAFPLVLTLVNLRSSTVGGAAALSGFTQGLGYLLAGLGPLVMGLLRETTEGWDVPLMFLIGGLTLQLAAGYLVSRPGSIEVQLALRQLRRRPATD
jgi:CP family cyanate transporter-like MFS transporter